MMTQTVGAAADQPCAQAERFAQQARRWGSAVHVLPVEWSHRPLNQQLGEASAHSPDQ